MIDGIIVVNKPENFTSHDVVAKARGILRTKKIGHAGTLDPMATGVLPLFIGNATKAVDRIPNQNKAYTATFRLGIATDTQDITGEVLEEKPVNVSLSQVEKAMKNYIGEISQMPPMYSAIRVDGQRLYDLARQGIEVERPSRKVYIYENKLLGYNEARNEYSYHIKCSKGTYIRTICHDLGNDLGTGATLISLERTYSSGFAIEGAVTLEELEVLARNDNIDSIILPVSDAFSEYERLDLDAQKAKMFCDGVPLWVNQFDLMPQDQWLRIYGPEELFLGIARASEKDMQLKEQKKFIGEVSF